MIHKLHKQFAHPSAKNLKALMKNAYAFNGDCKEIINSISEKCKVANVLRNSMSSSCMYATGNKIQPSCSNGFETVLSCNLFLTFYRSVHKIQFSKSYKEEIT